MAVKNMIRTTTTTKYWGSRIKKQFSNRKSGKGQTGKVKREVSRKVLEMEIRDNHHGMSRGKVRC